MQTLRIQIVLSHEELTRVDHARRELLAASPEFARCVRLMETVTRENLTSVTSDFIGIPLMMDYFLGPELTVWLRSMFCRLERRMEDTYKVDVIGPFDHVGVRMYSGNATRLGTATETGLELIVGNLSLPRTMPRKEAATFDWGMPVADLLSSFCISSSLDNAEVQHVLCKLGIVCDGAKYFSQFRFVVHSTGGCHMHMLAMRIPFENFPAMCRLYSAWLCKRPVDRVAEYMRTVTDAVEEARAKCIHHSEQDAKACDNCTTLHYQLERLKRQTQEAQTLLKKALPTSAEEAATQLDLIDRLRERFRLFLPLD